MKRRCARRAFRLFVSGLIGGLCVLSCKSLPAAGETPSARETPLEISIPEEDTLSVDLEPEEPPLPEEEPAPIEAQPDFAESDTPLVPLEEEELAIVLPEPEEPELPPFPAEDGIAREPAPEPLFPAAAETLTAEEEPAPVAVEPPPPEPPVFLRPAEPGVADVAREPAPVPVRPVPEAPARRPPVQPAEPVGRTGPRSGASVPPSASAPPAAGPQAGASSVPEGPAPVTPLDEITHSRTVQARVGQTVEIPFRGSGWVYLGEVDSRAGVTYTNRQNDPEGMRFGFRLDEQGEFELRFYRQDFIRDYIQNDHVRLIVEEAVPGGSAVVAAPRWPGAEARDTEAAPSGAGNAPGAAGSLPAAGSPDEGIVPVTPPTTTPTAAAAGPEAAAGTAAARQLGADTPPEEFLRRAREAYQAGRIGEALGILDRFRDIYPLGSDEAWWLYGQALEAAGPGRDIKTALEYYRRLVREYPQSPRYADARRRIAYLERFYFNIQ